MKTIWFALLLALPACMPMHGEMGMMMGEGDEGGMMHRKAPKWPTVRIDGLDGARVLMQRGVFGDGIDVIAPFQGSFQPTGDAAMAAYPFVMDLNLETARRFGGNHPMRLRALLTVPEAMHERGIMRIAPTVCAMRALIAGDIDKLKVTSEELPSPEMACAHESDDHHETCTMDRGHEDDQGCGQERGEHHGHHGHGGWAMFHRDDRATLTILVSKER